MPSAMFMSSCGSGRGVCRDGIDDSRPHRDRQGVPHALDDDEFGAEDRISRIDATGERHQRIVRAMDDECWQAYAGQRWLAVARREDGCELACRAGGVE